MRKFWLVLLVGTCSLFLLQAFVIHTADDDGLNRILSKLQEYVLTRPQEKVYLHVDKDTYVAGENIWFSVYLVNATNHYADSVSKTIYVDLFNSAKKLVQRRVLYSAAGFSQGDFHLYDTLSQGDYLIRAYTNYMKNAGEDFFFTKEISVIGASGVQGNKRFSSGAQPDVQFFPEGGDMLTDIVNQIAFKAVDKDGRGADVEGNVLDEKGNAVASFKSEHKGMGLLRFVPSFGHNYVAKIKNSDHLFALPVVLEKGYMLHVVDAGPDIKIAVYSNLKKFSDEALPIYLVAHTRGIVCYAARGEIKTSALTTKIPKSKLPTGITEITLFNGQGVPQCERLFFINHQDDLRLHVKSDRLAYEKKKPVDIELKVLRKNGTAAKGSFSIAVVDDVRLSPGKIKNTIVDNLLLTSDLAGYVEDPGYYLHDTLQQTKYNLDLLMLTHGWRRFTWKTVLQDIPDPVQYYPEKGIVVSGKILKSLSKKPSPDSEVKIFTSQHDILVLKTDNLGRFYSDDLLLNDSSQLMFQTDNAKGKKTDLQFFLDPFNVPLSLHYPFVALRKEKQDSLTSLILTKNNLYRAPAKTTLLKEVEVRGRRITTDNDNRSSSKLYGIPDQTIDMRTIPQGYTNILQALQGRVAGLVVMGNTVSIRGGGEPLFLLDGMQVDLTMITSSLSISDVESIDILKGPSASIYGMRGGNGVIAINTKKGYSFQAPTIGVHTLKYPGYYKAREFYSPNYDVIVDQKDTLDVRNTLYWNPSIKTNANGEAHVRFFTSDVPSQYKIIVEGISEDGIPGSGSVEMNVE